MLSLNCQEVTKDQWHSGRHIYITLGKPRLLREPVVKHCHRHRGVAQSGYYEREEMSSQCSLVGFNSHLILIFPLESLTIRTYCHTLALRLEIVSAFIQPTNFNNTKSATHQLTNIPTHNPHIVTLWRWDWRSEVAESSPHSNFIQLAKTPTHQQNCGLSWPLFLIDS